MSSPVVNRHRVRFGLRFLVVVVLVCAVVFAWLGGRLRAERQRMMALRELDRRGATFDAQRVVPPTSTDDPLSGMYPDPFAGSESLSDPFDSGARSIIYVDQGKSDSLPDWFFARVCDWLGESPPTKVRSIRMGPDDELSQASMVRRYGEDDIATLRRIGAIENLTLRCDELSDSSAQTLFSIPDLRYLYLNTPSLGGGGKAIGSADDLGTFVLLDAELELDQFHAIGSLPNLETLSLQRVTWTAPEGQLTEVLASWGQAAKLDDLILDQMSSRFWRSLPSMPGVTSLTIFKPVDAPEADFHALLSKFPNLDSIRLTGMDGVSAEDLRGLARVPKLRVLSMVDCALSDAAVAEIANHVELRYLSLLGCDLGDTAMAGIVANETLEHLNVSYNAIGDPGLEQLESLGRLQVLDISETLVTATGKIKFFKRHPQCSESTAFYCSFGN